MNSSSGARATSTCGSLTYLAMSRWPGLFGAQQLQDVVVLVEGPAPAGGRCDEVARVLRARGLAEGREQVQVPVRCGVERLAALDPVELDRPQPAPVAFVVADHATFAA